MNILILNSWLKEYLTTNATPQQFADAMSLTSVSIEHMEKVEDDIVYDIEVTTNRPDLMSIHGIAREALAVLPEAGYEATFKPRTINYSMRVLPKSPFITIQNDPTLVNRIVAVVMDVTLGESPKIVKERLTKTGIRSINNVVDVTNYIMRELGHPVHAFDYDRIEGQKLVIRRSKKGEKIETLDGNTYELLGNDIIAEDGSGRIVDLLGIMGLSNSSITSTTKRVLLFIDNNNPQFLRKTSMSLGIRTEAAVLNEKGVNPELMLPTLLHGIELLKSSANGKIVSDIVDIYPNKPILKSVHVTFERINSIIGIEINKKTVLQILGNLGFTIKKKDDIGIEVIPPYSRINDIEIPEDIVEEVARVYGYHKIPNLLPPITSTKSYHLDSSEFYWEEKVKQAFKYWGFNETYTYSMVSEALFDGPVENAVTLRNPLTEDRAYMRDSLIPSLLEVVRENKRDITSIFEIANVYLKNGNNLPIEERHVACVIHKQKASFLEIKGIVEQLAHLMGLSYLTFKDGESIGDEIGVFYKGKKIGDIELLDKNTVNFELNFSCLLEYANLKKSYKIPPKYPPIIEDVRVRTDSKTTFDEIVKFIKKQSTVIKNVELLDVYDNKKTYRIYFQDATRNLTNEDIAPIREKLYKSLEKEFNATIG